MEIRFRGMDRINRMLQGVDARAKDCTPAFKAIGVMQVRSTQKNFDVGGRPEKWLQSKRAARQGESGRKSGKTLVDSGRGKNSITFEAGPKNVIIGPSSPAAIYMKAHQLGLSINIPEIRPRNAKALRWMGGDGRPRFARKIKAHTVQMSKREFLMFHEEDIRWAKRAIVDFVLGNT